MDSILKNLTPKQAKKFLEKNGFVLMNVRGDHFVYYKKVDGVIYTPSVIDNNKQLYKPNILTMIRKSGIPEKEWAKFKK